MMNNKKMLSFNLSQKNLAKPLFNTQVKIKENLIKENNLEEKEFQNKKDIEEENKKLMQNIISKSISELKETIHKEYIQFQHSISDNIKNYSQELKKISANEKRLIEQFVNLKVKTDKIEIFSEKLSKIEEKLTTFEIRFNNLSKDYRDSVNKYDSLFLDNMNVPGKIGKYYRYKNIREFLSYAYDKFNQLDLINDKNIIKMKNIQEKYEKFIKKINLEIELKEENMQVNSKKIGILENKFSEEINEIKKKAELIPDDFNIEKKINSLIENYSEVKNIKDYIYDKIIIIEKDIQIIKKFLKHKHKTIHSKKNSKVNFTNLSAQKTENNKKMIGDNITKSSKSSKTINIHSKKVDKYNYLNKNIINKQQSINMDNINEELNENNENNSLNNDTIKPIKYSSVKLNRNDSEKSLNNNEKSSFKDTYSVNTPSIEDSSYNDVKKENIENIIDEKEEKIEKYNSFGEQTELNGTNIDEKIDRINNDLIQEKNDKNKVKNLKNTKKRKKKKNSFTTIKPKMKIDNIVLNDKNKNIDNLKNIIKPNEKCESNNSKRNEKTIQKNLDIENKKSHSESIIKSKKKINLLNFGIKKKMNKDIIDINNNIKPHNIEIFNNNTIKNILNDRNNKNIFKYNRSSEYPKINNDIASLISLGNNNTGISFINNIQLNSHEFNRKNKEIPMKKTYYQIIQIESLKKEALKNNITQTILNPKEIPIITNSSMNHSYSNKKYKSRINLVKKKIYKPEKKHNNINLELKIIPANFKVSKKIQVNERDNH